ncbi:YiiX/YebB-like N1pC/P60 family cysteine hydrolase [uncultured Hyphomicrobium sp.]|uniref:YiiX/YebB-like N1pC/P60 family cysteine hydrolase n=1 Tax=uncultured Hyphomicrobium sp. TaxID=194373 RepID=UPI0025D6C4F6|nr:YiiX/YebB-like N1pC/P60 family cysteine hydrolase [uncultured Hyphomicrobium sp.]
MQRSIVTGIEERLAEVDAVADRHMRSAGELEAMLRSLYQLLYDTDLGSADRREVAAAAPQLLQRLFISRLRLRDRIAGWQAQHVFSRPAQSALRDVFRIARYGTDMLGEIANGNARFAPGEKSKRGFTGKDWNTLVHPAFDTSKDIPFRSGDVLLMRGSAHNSAAIARIGDVDTQFSHIAIIYVDPEGKHWVVEALIEDGSVINSLDHVLDHGLGRAVLYRFRDNEIAARAAKLAYDRVLATRTGTAPHIPYDFSMRLKGRRKLFCAKLVAQAYADASNGEIQLPAYKTHLDQRNNKAFLKAIGVRAKETFAPGDIDLDPRFDLVAEWQDYRATPLLRRQDMIMTKFFEWMETKGYVFHEDFIIKLISVFGRLSSHLSDRAKNLLSSVVPKVPSNMKRSCIATIAMLHKSAEEVMPSLSALDDDHVRMTGFPLHPREMFVHLERLREVSDGRIGYLRGKA